MAIEQTLDRLVEGNDLSAQEAQEALEVIMSGNATEAQIGAFLVALRMKVETPDEITGFARAMRGNCIRIECSRANLVDTCGTGGDKLDTFNISTAAALVAAGAGVPIAKHGNRSVSSQCGSADVLKELGVNIEASPEIVECCIDEIGIGFLFAPALHPAMKYAIGPRRELKLRTVFNVLGPLTNPAGATRQVLGVCDAALTEPLAEALAGLGTEHALVVHGMCGMDEISTLGETQVSELKDGTVGTKMWAPEDFGLKQAEPEDIAGGDVAESAQALVSVLEGEPGPRRDIVALNTAAAIYVGGLVENVPEGLKLAQDTIDSGVAKEKLEQLVALSNKAD